MGIGATLTAYAATAATHPARIQTRDRQAIVRWAQQNGAQPARGVAAPSDGGAWAAVVDAAVGIRFNFRGEKRFKPIPWSEWFAEFDAYRLIFSHPADGVGCEDRTRVALPCSG